MITTKTHDVQRYGYINVKPQLSIVIVTYNAGEEIFDCLNSLKKQSEQNFEVIVVDNGTMNIDRLANYDISYYKSTLNRGPSPSRNFGIQVAKSQIVAFLDDDAVATVDWAENILRSFVETKVVGIRGKILPKYPHNILNSLQSHYNLGNNIFTYFVDLEGNSAFKRSALLAVGGFSPELFGHEGVELCYRLNNRFPKQKIYYIPNVVILHEYSDSLIKLVRKALRHGYVSTRLGSKNAVIQNYQKQYKLLAKANDSTMLLRILRILLLGINYVGGLGYNLQKWLWLSKKPARVKK